MKLFDKLLGYFHAAFDKEPKGVLAFRILHASPAFNWRVENGVLFGFDGSTQLFAIALDGHTLKTLIDYLWTVSGISLSDAAAAEYLTPSAATLIPASGFLSQSNGDALYAYTSFLWMYVDVMAAELAIAKARLFAALDQMSIKTADADWLDEWGSYFSVLRQTGESDSTYANRIVVEVMRPRGNNTAIEMALLANFGQTASVIDVVQYKNAIRTYNGSVNHNSTWQHNATNDPIYGLFQVIIGYDILSGGDQAAFATSVRALIEKFRDAGTQLESLSLAGSSISDSVAATTTDVSADLTITTSAAYDGFFTFNGTAFYSGTASTFEYLS